MKHKYDTNKIKRVQVTFTDKQWRLIEQFRGVMGSEDAGD
jgi:hypothetical protein